MIIVSVFSVKIPADDDFESIDHATAKAERYLYSPFRVLATEYVHETSTEPGNYLRVVIGGTFLSGMRAEGQTENQRDRFASGMYATTTPHFNIIND